MPTLQLECPVCSSTLSRQLPAWHEWMNVRWQLQRCADCGHRYTNPVPTAAELHRMYADEYFAAGGAWVCGFWSGGYIDNEEKLRREARSTIALLPTTGLRMLEIGAAGGFFLDEARAAGYSVTGVELNRSMATWGRDHLGLDIFCGEFEKLDFEVGSFDVIVAQDVLEHVREPRIFVARVSRLLAPGGVFLVRGPLEQSWKDTFFTALRRLRSKGATVLTEPPYHLQGFVRESFRRLIESAGLHLTRFESRAIAPMVDLKSPKGVTATAIEVVAFGANKLTSRGDFMIGCATQSMRPNPTPQSSPPTRSSRISDSPLTLSTPDRS